MAYTLQLAAEVLHRFSAFHVQVIVDQLGQTVVTQLRPPGSPLTFLFLPLLPSGVLACLPCNGWQDVVMFPITRMHAYTHACVCVRESERDHLHALMRWIAVAMFFC